jgi:hypothetical protein
MSLDDTFVSWNDTLIPEEGANGKHFNLFPHRESLPGPRRVGFTIAVLSSVLRDPGTLAKLVERLAFLE